MAHLNLLNEKKNAETDWALERSPARPGEAQLNGLAIAWSVQLERQIHPAELIKRFPRLANRLALCWNDPVLAAKLIDSLIKDRRGGRKGFPPEVQAELLQLRAIFPSEQVNEPAGHWNLLATSDR